jgi:hypothetical protein
MYLFGARGCDAGVPQCLDEVVEDDSQRDPKVISDCIALAAYLYRASRGEADAGLRW